MKDEIKGKVAQRGAPGRIGVWLWLNLLREVVGRMRT